MDGLVLPDTRSTPLATYHSAGQRTTLSRVHTLVGFLYAPARRPPDLIVGVVSLPPPLPTLTRNIPPNRYSATLTPTTNTVGP
jgi:hypothetical protein